jgi:hypothetical protein
VRCFRQARLSVVKVYTYPKIYSNQLSDGSVYIWLFISTSPLTPLQPEPFQMKENSSWLERGVKKRGGFAPSLKLLPLQDEPLSNKRIITGSRGNCLKGGIVCSIKQNQIELSRWWQPEL